MKKKNLVLVTLLFSVVLCLFCSYYVYVNSSIKKENEEVEYYFLKKYSKEFFINQVVSKTNTYRQKDFVKFIHKNYDLFISNNNGIENAINQYINLYDTSFIELNKLKNKKVITKQEYKLIKKYLNNFRFRMASIVIETSKTSINLTSKDKIYLLSQKEYFKGIVNQLDFNYKKAKLNYINAIRLSKCNPNYYHKLGLLYYSLYDFKSAIDTFEDGLSFVEFKKRKSKYSKLDLLYNLSKTYIAINDYDNAISKLSDLLIYSKQLNDEKYEWLSVFNIALIKSNLGEYLNSIENLKYALKLALKIRDTNYIAETLNLLSNSQYYYGDYNNGVKNSLKTIKYAKKSKNISLISSGSLNACLNYDYIDGKKNLSDNYCKRALHINEKLGESTNDPSFYLKNAFIVSYVANFRDYKKSLDYLSTSFDLAHSYNLKLSELSTLYEFSNVEMLLNHKETAIKRLNDAIKLRKSLKINEYLFENILFGEICWWIDNNLEKSIVFYKRALSASINKNNKRYAGVSTSHLANIYNALKDYKRALRYATLALDFDQKMYINNHHYIRYQMGWKKNIDFSYKNMLKIEKEKKKERRRKKIDLERQNKKEEDSNYNKKEKSKKIKTKRGKNA